MSPFDWTEFLVVADDLASRGADEATARTAIGRAYYAAFGSARRHLGQAGVTIPQTGAAHPLVWETFHRSPDRVRRRIANRGRQLLRRRRQADYDDHYPMTTTEVERSVGWARKLLHDLRSLG